MKNLILTSVPFCFVLDSWLYLKSFGLFFDSIRRNLTLNLHSYLLAWDYYVPLSSSDKLSKRSVSYAAS